MPLGSTLGPPVLGAGVEVNDGHAHRGADIRRDARQIESGRDPEGAREQVQVEADGDRMTVAIDHFARVVVGELIDQVEAHRA